MQGWTRPHRVATQRMNNNAFNIDKLQTVPELQISNLKMIQTSLKLTTFNFTFFWDWQYLIKYKDSQFTALWYKI
jgi:hypothetical protein